MKRELVVNSKNIREKLLDKEGGSFFCFKVLPYTVFSLVAGLIFRRWFYFIKRVCDVIWVDGIHAEKGW